MHEFALSLHHAVFEKAFVMVAFRPAICALTVHFVVFEITLVCGAITVNCKALSVFFVVVPGAFILSQNSIAVALAVIDLKSIPLSNFGVSFSQLGCT